MHIRYKVVTEDRKSYWIGGEAALTYAKGSIVKDHKEGLGIMTFKSLTGARAFVGKHTEFETEKIIKVRPIGRALKEPMILDLTQGTKISLSKISELSKKLKAHRRTLYQRMSFIGTENIGDSIVCWPYRGTLCYKAVEVLE